MNAKQHFLRNFAYDYWANRECLSALTDANPVPPKVLHLIAHTLSAQNSGWNACNVYRKALWCGQVLRLKIVPRLPMKCYPPGRTI